MLNFKAAKERAKQSLKNTNMMAIVLGPSGAGKSYLAGTFQEKTLFLYTKSEDHGFASAAIEGQANILPVCIDNDDEGNPISGDEAIKRLHLYLGSVEELKKEGVKAIVVDGATELEAIFLQTTEWKNLCKTNKGDHNNFKESDAYKTMFRKVINQLKTTCEALDAHGMMTGILDVKDIDDKGAINEATPKLSGYGVIESVIQQFPDVLVIGSMRNKAGKMKPRIQFMTTVSKISKDEIGDIKKAMNFNPRLKHVSRDNLPEHTAADMKELVALKKNSQAD